MTKFSQKGHFKSKTEKVDTIIEFYIFIRLGLVTKFQLKQF